MDTLFCYTRAKEDVCDELSKHDTEALMILYAALLNKAQTGSLFRCKSYKTRSYLMRTDDE